MADFDPFALNEGQKDNEMPVFASFDTVHESKNEKKEPNKKEEIFKEQDTGFGSFGSFAPFDSGPSNNADDNSGFPTFESFDSGPKKDNDAMPTFESFATPSNDVKSFSPPQSKPPTFDSDSDNDEIKINKDKEPLFASFTESLRAASTQEEDNQQQEQKEQQEITSEQQNALNFPSFGSFPTFESNNNNTGSNSSSNKEFANTQDNKSKLKQPEEKTQKLSAVTALSSIKNLLKPIPGTQSTLDLNPDHCKISIPSPKPFKETALAKELSEYCMKVFNHQYIFTD